jgi:hypothetical protein
MRSFCLFLLWMLIPVIAFTAPQEEFIRGLWQVFPGGCLNGLPVCPNCPDTFWGEYIIPTSEQVLIDSIGANNLHSHFYGIGDFLPVLRYCESTNGRVKVYAGFESRGMPRQPYQEFGYWAGGAYNYNNPIWQAGVGNTLFYYDSIFHYLSSPGLRGINIFHECATDPMYYQGLEVEIDSIKNHDPNNNLKTSGVWCGAYFSFPQFTQIVNELDYFEDDYYLFWPGSGT